MSNKIFGLSVIINIILAIAIIALASDTYNKMQFSLVREKSMGPEVIMSGLDRENYGVVARFARPIRGEAEIYDKDKDLYMIGEYADVLFNKEIFENSGDTDSCKAMADRAARIRSEMPDYSVIFDKIDYSVEHAVASGSANKGSILSGRDDNE